MPKSAVAEVSHTGDEALHVQDLGLGDATDAVIATYAQDHGFVLVTRDLDFADVRAYPPATHAGIVVLRLPEHTVAAEIKAIFSRLLLHRDIVERVSGHLAIVEADRVRVRPPLDPLD